MKLELILPESELEFIRHARRETLVGLGEQAVPDAIEPAPFGYYVIAYDGGRPVAMAELSMHEHVYGTYANCPYADRFRLAEIAPISEFAGIRTVFIEPAYRARAGSLYVQLVTLGAKIVTSQGARFGTASTAEDNDQLRGLYAKTGRPLGAFRNPGASADVTVFVFDIFEFLQKRAFQRIARSMDGTIDSRIIAELHSRVPRRVAA